MNNIQNIILVRHGETTKDKSDLDRRLTSRGKVMMQQSALKLKDLLDRDVTLTSTNNIRSIQSTEILSVGLNIPFTKDICPYVDSFLIKDWRPIKTLRASSKLYKDIDLTEIYFDLYQKGILPQNVPYPEEVGQKFCEMIDSLNLSTKSMIIVANGGSLEAAAFYQSFYVPEIGDKMYSKPIQYSEFIVLEKQ